MKTNNYIGKKYGRLTVISKSEDKKSKSGKTTYHMYLCKCDCGNMVEAMIGHLISGHTKSCGCLKNKWNVKNERLFNCWCNMKQRCESSGRRDSKYYHDKGIRYCESWKDYNKFQEWALSNGYDDDLTLDRIDNSKNYSPENCRWVTAQEQQRNKQNCRIYTYNGKTQTLSEWAIEYNIPFQTLASRIDKLGYTFENALKKPYGYQKTNVFLEFNGKLYTEAEFARFIGYTNSGVSRLVRLGYNAEQIYQNSVEYKKKKQIMDKEGEISNPCTSK